MSMLSGWGDQRARAERAEAALHSEINFREECVAAAAKERDELKSELAALRQRVERAEAELFEQRALATAGKNSAHRIGEKLREAQATIAEPTDELERERMRLAACSTAALGYFQEPCLDEYRSAALSDVLALRERNAELTATVERMRDFVRELADEGCHYADNCPPFANTRHGTCLSCRARAALGEP